MSRGESAPLQSLADLGALVRATRLARQLTQAGLAARLGLSVRLVAELERGTRDLRASNLLHVLARMGFDLVAVPRAGRAMPLADSGRRRVRTARPAGAE